MNKLIILCMCMFITTVYATNKHNPEPKSPPAVSKPEPRAPQTRSDTVDRPCDRGINAPVWCNLENKA